MVSSRSRAEPRFTGFTSPVEAAGGSSRGFTCEAGSQTIVWQGPGWSRSWSPAKQALTHHMYHMIERLAIGERKSKVFS